MLPSNRALALLQAALSSPYPQGSASKSPLKFDLEVIENAPPTADQIRSILDYLPRIRDVDDPHHVAALISSHPSAPSLPDRPHSPEGLVRLAQKSPLALRWPIVVDWTSGRASAGDVDTNTLAPVSSDSGHTSLAIRLADILILIRTVAYYVPSSAYVFSLNFVSTPLRTAKVGSVNLFSKTPSHDKRSPGCTCVWFE